jgi:hypothetical protein
MGFWEALGAVVLGAAAIAGVIFLVKITYDAIKKWLANAKDRHPNAQTAELVRKKLSDGKFSVVSGVFDNRGNQLETQTWEGKEMDPELKKKFGMRKKIVLDLDAL